MSHKIRIFISIIFALSFSSNNIFAGYGGKLTRPKEARIDLSDRTISQFDEDLSRILFRYLAGNPRWEIREERGLRYAVRLERVNSEYRTAMNGYYTAFDKGVMRQTRVLVSFGRAYGFGRDRGNITRALPGKKDVPVIIEGGHDGTPGNSSYVIVSGGNAFLEFYDQAPEVKRRFTQRAFDEVSAELADVIRYRKAVEKSGILPVLKHYPKPLPEKRFMEVRDGMEPGIYLVEAAVSPSGPGYAYIKAFNTKTGERLSGERMTQRSLRYTGWSEGGRTLFFYGSEFTVYEGDWSSAYRARFELWHRSEKGVEKKLSQKTRMINGWER